MLRITEYIRETLEGKKSRAFEGVILIWNLTNACNLYCKHCYSSANQEREGELSHEEVVSLVHRLPSVGVRFAILSGGEPLLREDIFQIAGLLKERGIRTYLSTNGLLVKEQIVEIKKHFDYVGISVDGEPEVHDAFRGKRGAFEESLKAVRECLKEGIRVGLRFTLTPATSRSLPFIFSLAEKEEIPKIYISHLVYSGRGKRLSDLEREEYRRWVRFILDKSFEYVEKGIPIDVVTGNNEADAVLLYREFVKRYPRLAKGFYERLLLWGGNQAGVRLMNIDFRGNVKPDPFFFHGVGNVREEDILKIWQGNGLLSFLREKPRRLKGRCERCSFIGICNGNSRARAYAVYGDYAEEDPACYL
ncbi:MAG: radical SAM protein [Aquificaceae bacterium]|uniref:radical SAM protein n=1 Tax=Hydrogenobacter sp. Uz 6-8 TaxID=3384828 RepID=UPI0030A8B26E